MECKDCKHYYGNNNEICYECTASTEDEANFATKPTRKCIMNTQTSNTRGIDYDNYPVIDLGENVPLNCGNSGRFEVIRPDGRSHGIYNDAEVAVCDLRWYMERQYDTVYGVIRD